MDNIIIKVGDKEYLCDILNIDKENDKVVISYKPVGSKIIKVNANNTTPIVPAIRDAIIKNELKDSNEAETKTTTAIRNAFNIGDTIKDLLIQKKLSQKEFGNMVNLSESVVSRYIANERRPNCHILVKMAKALNVSTDYLLGVDNE